MHQKMGMERLSSTRRTFEHFFDSRTHIIIVDFDYIGNNLS